MERSFRVATAGLSLKVSLMKVGDLVGYINGDGPTGIVLDIWSQRNEAHGEVNDLVQVLWDDGEIEEECLWNVEVIDESR